MIPVYEAQIINETDGIFKISLVDRPAVSSNFLFFKKQNKALKYNNVDNVNVNYSIQDEDKHIVFGVLMRADYNIYRIDPKIGEYYIRYSKETIQKMAERMLVANTQNNINLMHLDNSDVEGVNLLEIFIKDTSKGISPKGFEDIEEGSLFCSYKVNNEEVWQAIKDGTFLGFSLEGIFSIDLDKNINKSKKSNTYMNKLSKKLMKNIVKFGSVKTNDGELYWVGEGELEIGDELFQDTEDGRVKVEDGTYTTEDGTEITVTEGLVSDIKKKEDEVEVDAEDEEIEKLKNDVATLFDEVEKLKGITEELTKQLADVLQKPAVEPIVDQFNKVQKNNGGIPAFGSRSRLI